MEKQQITRRTLLTKQQVSVNVPNHGKFMRLIAAASFIDNTSGQAVSIPEHYQFGYVFGKVIVFANFYLGEDKIGKKIIATVEVIEKTVGDQRYIMLDVHPTEGRPEFDLKFPTDGSGDIEVPGCTTKIWFRKIGQK